MKNKLDYIILNIIAVAVALVAASTMPAAELVLSADTKSGGVTTTVTVGRIQADPAADGSLVLQVIPRQVVSLQDGTIISDKFAAEWITVNLSASTVAAINAEIAAAKVAADAAKAQAAADAAKDAAP
jgi:hypothetical protein